MDADTSMQMVMSVTNTTPELAQQYLTLADGEPEQAITLFFENGGADLAGTHAQHSQAPVQSSPPHSHPTRAGHEDDEGRIVIDDDEEATVEHASVTRDRDTSPNARLASLQNSNALEDDAAMAARLQQEMYSGGDASEAYDEDGVRAPIARQAHTLVGPGASDDVGMGRDAITRQMDMLRTRAAAGRSGRAGIFNQRDIPESIWDERDSSRQRDALARSTGGASNQSSKSQALAQLFRPPYEIMFKGGFEEAKDEGRNTSKWLLVDIHDQSVFDCQALNRDIWKHAGIVETVRENFIFMQYNKDDPRATQYLQYYFQDYEMDSKYPHIAILDPRTGEQVKVWSGSPLLKAPDFLMQLHEFLDRYSLEAHARNPVARRKAEPKKEKQVSEMSEEEQLEMAMQASLAAGGSSTDKQKTQDPDELTKSITQLDKGKGKAVLIPDDDAEMTDQTGSGGSTRSVTETSQFAKIPSDQPHEEPAAGPNMTRIAFRHPSGRIIRKFSLGDNVRRIYEWLKASPLEGKQGVEFELVSSGKNMIDSLDESIDQAGLKNATVMIEFLEG
ncbi:MAG: hypothetical protein Q9160_004271 [Pyrenula sp. 1 TL-2023]